MSKTKAGGTSKNNRDPQGKRLGVKAFGGETVTAGSIIIRQIGSNKRAGAGTRMGKDFTIYATKDGTVEFKKARITRFTGKTAPRVIVKVV